VANKPFWEYKNVYLKLQAELGIVLKYWVMRPTVTTKIIPIHSARLFA
jgi:hypothetical protein